MPTTTLSVTAGGDDGVEEGDGTVTLTTTSISADGADNHLAFIFRSVPIPPGSTVNEALLQVYTVDSNADSPNVDIAAEVAPANLTTATNDISNRTTGAESVAWVASDIGINAYKDSPDISTVIQEAVDDGGWSENEDLAIIASYRSSGSGWLKVETANATNEPLLYLDWTEGGGGGPTPLDFAYPGDFWPGGYWSEYWPDYGTGSPPATIIPIIQHHLRQQGIG